MPELTDDDIRALYQALLPQRPPGEAAAGAGLGPGAAARGGLPARELVPGTPVGRNQVWGEDGRAHPIGQVVGDQYWGRDGKLHPRGEAGFGAYPRGAVAGPDVAAGAGVGAGAAAGLSDVFEGKPRYSVPGLDVPMLVGPFGGDPVPVYDLENARQMLGAGWTVQGWRKVAPDEGPWGTAAAQAKAQAALEPAAAGAGAATGYGQTGWPSFGLATGEEAGRVAEYAKPLPSTPGAEGKPALPFLSAQSWSRLLPSEQAMWMSEIENRGFPAEDWRAQWQRQAGTAGFAAKPGAMSFGGAGGRLALSPMRFGV